MGSALRDGFAALIGWMFIASAWAVEEPDPGIPFRLHREHHIVAQGSIGKLEGLNLIIDTGATSTVIHEAIAAKLGLKGASRKATAFGRRIVLKTVAIPEICLKGFCFASATARVGNLYFFQGLRVDALIGIDLLKTSTLTIDFASGTLGFGDMPQRGPSMGFPGNLPYVMLRLEVGGVPLRLKLDSGAGNDFILYRPHPDRPYPWRLTDEVREIRHMGGEVSARKVILSEVRMAESEWSEMAALLFPGKQREPGSLDGSIGLGALGFTIVHLDFQRGRISWAE